jgi:hypothetical protein
MGQPKLHTNFTADTKKNLKKTFLFTAKELFQLSSDNDITTYSSVK